MSTALFTIKLSHASKIKTALMRYVTWTRTKNRKFWKQKNKLHFIILINSAHENYNGGAHLQMQALAETNNCIPSKTPHFSTKTKLISSSAFVIHYWVFIFLIQHHVNFYQIRQQWSPEVANSACLCRWQACFLNSFFDLSFLQAPSDPVRS